MDPAEKVRPENSVSGQKGYKFGQKNPDPARKGTNSAIKIWIRPEQQQQQHPRSAIIVLYYTNPGPKLLNCSKYYKTLPFNKRSGSIYKPGAF